MQSENVLLALSQFALALAGFTGVVISFGMNDGSWHAADAFRTRRALISSLNAAFLALVPVVLSCFGLGERVVWQAASVVFLVNSIFWIRFDAPRHWLSRVEMRGVIPSWGPVLLYGGAAVIILVLSLNATGWAFEPQPGPFVMTLIVYLSLPAIIFVRIPFVRPPSGS